MACGLLSQSATLTIAGGGSGATDQGVVLAEELNRRTAAWQQRLSGLLGAAALAQEIVRAGLGVDRGAHRASSAADANTAATPSPVCLNR